MDRLLTLALLSSAVLVTSQRDGRSADREEPRTSTLAEAADEYGLRTDDLTRRLFEASGASGNACFSPVAIQHVAAILHRGAGGQTRDEIETAFGFGNRRLPPLAGTALLVPSTLRRSFGFGVRVVENGGYGLKIVQVVDGSPAAKAGLDVQDLMLAIDGVGTTDESEFANAIDYSTGTIAVTAFDHSRGVVRTSIVELEELDQPNAATAPGTIEFNTGVWVAKRFELQPDFAAAVRRVGGDVAEAPFAENPVAAVLAINAWATKRGFGNVPLLEDTDITTDTKSVIANVFAISVPWQRRFDPRRTTLRPFRVTPERRTDVPMMQAVGEYHCTFGEGVDAVELPLAHPRLTVLLVRRSDPRTTLALNGIRRSLERRFIDLRVPRFAVDGRLDLRDVLRRLGVERAFDASAANFENLAAEPLVVDRAHHECRIVLDENGLEAKSGTVVSLVPRSEVERTLTFDSPFDCLVLDRATQAVLFAARIADPANE